MPKGINQTSALIAISTSITESAANTFSFDTVDLQLSPLDNQIFVITKVDADLQTPSLVAGTRASLDVTLSTVQRTNTGSLADNNVVAVFRKFVEGAAGLTTSINSIDESPDQSAPGMDYLAIVFTSDLFLNIAGANNTAALTGNARIWGYVATATSSVYAAGVQQELLG